MAHEPLDPDAVAQSLRAAEPGDGFIPLLSDQYPDLTWDDARAIARARDEHRRGEGDECVGYKLGWTSAAMRQALGIDRPNWGTLWSSQRLEAALERSSLRHPKIEPELVYVAGARLGADATLEQVRSTAAGWAVGLEVVDPRFVDFGFRWLDNTADNSSAGGFATSEVSTAPVTDPATWLVEVADGSERRSGTGEVVMDSPAAAVVWLAHRLAEEGDALEPGMIVFTGGITAPFDAARGVRYVARCEALGLEVGLDVV